MGYIYVYDGSVVNINCSTTGEKTVATINTDLPSGVNSIIAIMQIGYVTVGGIYFVFEVKKGTTILSQDEFSTTAPVTSDIHRDSCRFLLARDTSASANETYTIVMNVTRAASATIAVEVKCIIVNVSYSAFVDGSQVTAPSGSATTLVSLSTSLPSGNYVVVTAIAGYPSVTANYLIGAGNLRLKKGTTVVASNQFNWGSYSSSQYLYGFLIYYDAGSSANPSYSVEVYNASGTSFYFEAKLLVFRVNQGWFQDTGSVALSTSETTIVNLSTSLSAQTEVGTIASVQFENTTTSSVVIVNTGNLKLQMNNSTTDQQVNDIEIYATDTSHSGRAPFVGLAKKWVASGNDSFQVKATSTQSSGVNAETKIVAFAVVVPVAYQTTLTEILGLNDSVVKVSSVVKSERLGLSDVYGRSWAAYRTYIEPLGLKDTTTKDVSVVKRESLGLSDVYARIWMVQRVYSELLGLKDTAAKSVSAFKVERLGLSDVVSSVRLYTRTLTELLGLSDVAVKAPSVVRAESLGLLDYYSRLWSAHRTYSETLGLADKVQKASSAVKSEPLGLSDMVQKSSSILKLELLGLSDFYSRTWTVYRTYTESLGLSDKVVKTAAVPLSETLGLFDKLTKSSFTTKTESLGLADFTVKGVSVARTERLGLSDVMRKASGKTFYEALGLKDAYSRLFSVHRTFTEPLGLKDTVFKDVMHTLTEVLGLIDRLLYCRNPTVISKIIRKLMQVENILGREVEPEEIKILENIIKLYEGM
jgi:hypothetical protein